MTIIKKTKCLFENQIPLCKIGDSSSVKLERSNHECNFILQNHSSPMQRLLGLTKDIYEIHYVY